MQPHDEGEILIVLDVTEASDDPTTCVAWLYRGGASGEKLAWLR